MTPGRFAPREPLGLLVSRVRFSGAAVFFARGSPDGFHDKAQQRDAQDEGGVNGKQRRVCGQRPNPAFEVQEQQHDVANPHHAEAGACVPVIYSPEKFLCVHPSSTFLKNVVFCHTPSPILGGDLVSLPFPSAVPAVRT